MKIYSNDKLVPYKTTTLTAMQSKTEIDVLLFRHGAKRVAWNYNPDQNEVYVMFNIEETIEGRRILIPVKVDAPAIWDKGSRRKAEKLNWDISLRCMLWYVKTHLEMSYVMQSEKILGFLPHIVGADEKTTLKDVILRDLNKLNEVMALPEVENKEAPRNNVIEADFKEN